jgi:hypothetical protein
LLGEPRRAGEVIAIPGETPEDVYAHEVHS